MDHGPTPPFRQVRALYDDETITVYQAYRPEIAEAAVRAGRFVAPFSLNRMTWIKPSFLWMMYRCGWATKPGQERVLAVRVTRRGFEDALATASLSHFDPAVHRSHDDWAQALAGSPVRVQWDPERDRDLRPLRWRSLQVGLSGPAVHSYATDWTVGVTDVTDHVRALRSATHAEAPLPAERPYLLPVAVASRIGATVVRPEVTRA